MDKATAGLRKRQQIGQANRMMFLWIIIISMVVGVSAVLSLFLVQKILFGEKVLGEKNKTVKVLEDNLDNAKKLKDSINVLGTNKDLQSVSLNDNSSTSGLQSVLDALPADANPTALAASLQTKLLAGISGVSLETLAVDSASTAGDVGASNSDGTAIPIGFTFSVSTSQGDYEALTKVLTQLERSIRPINVTMLTIEAQGSRSIMTVKGASYYQPAKDVQLTDKVVKP